MLLAARNDESVEELNKRAEAARLEDRPPLYIQIARKRLADADTLYRSGDSEAARAPDPAMHEQAVRPVAA